MKKSELKEIADESMERAIGSAQSENPLEAWTKFIDILDLSGRKAIKEQIKKEGRNPYTGDKIPNV